MDKVFITILMDACTKDPGLMTKSTDMALNKAPIFMKVNGRRDCGMGRDI